MLSESNYINLDLGVKERDKYIYRMISVDRLYELFSKNQNVLVSLSKWDDPFENFIMKSKFKNPNDDLVTIEFRNDFYGQCWTQHKASDAMWRIYSSESKGVRIRTTFSKLANSLALTLGESKDSECFIGKVSYLNNKKLMDFANSIFKGISNPGGDLLAKTLLVKRPAFKHEKEVRLLYFNKGNVVKSCVHKYAIDPHELIDQIMIDPRLNHKEVEKTKECIKNKTGFKGRILRSNLYVLPKDLIFPLG